MALNADGLINEVVSVFKALRCCMYGFQVGDNRSSRVATTAGNALFCASEHQRQPVAMLCFAHLSTIIIKQWHCKEPEHHVQDVQSWIRIVVISMGGSFTFLFLIFNICAFVRV